MDDRFKLYVEKIVNNERLTDEEKVNAIRRYLNNPDDPIIDLIIG